MIMAFHYCYQRRVVLTLACKTDGLSCRQQRYSFRSNYFVWPQSVFGLSHKMAAISNKEIKLHAPKLALPTSNNTVV
jgi:hypothetical protein